MTQAHVTDREVASYERRRLSPIDLVRVTDHLASCEACRRRMVHGDDRNVATDLRAALLDEPPDDRKHFEKRSGFSAVSRLA